MNIKIITYVGSASGSGFLLFKRWCGKEGMNSALHAVIDVIKENKNSEDQAPIFKNGF